MSRRPVIAAIALLVLAAGCGGGGSGSDGHSHSDEPSAFAAGDATTVVEGLMIDFAFPGVPASVKGPKVFFEMANTADKDHELLIFDRAGEEVGGLHLGPGDSGELAVELAPGTYSAQCRVETEGQPHTALGMQMTLTVS